MKVRVTPPPTPFKEVDPEDVVVTELRVGLYGHEAYGYLKSETRLVPSVQDHGAIREPPRWEAGSTYRVAYQNANGTWQVEGTTERIPPPAAVMRQIIQLLGAPAR